MTLPIHKRYEIIFLHHHPLGPKLGLKDTAEYVGCAKSTVTFWSQRWKKSEDLSDNKITGRPRKTTSKQDQVIVQIAEKKTDPSTIEIQKQIKKRKIEVSLSTINRRLHEFGGKYMNKLSKPLLTEKQMEGRKWH
jgi:transposase